MFLTRIAPLAALLAAASLATARQAAAQQPTGAQGSQRPAAADSQFVADQPVRFNNREGSQYNQGSASRGQESDAGGAQPLGTPVRQDAADRQRGDAQGSQSRGGQAQGRQGAAAGVEAGQSGNRAAAQRTRMRVRKES